MSILSATLGLFSIKWENPQYLTNLANTAIWDQHITETSRLIGKEISLKLDNIYVEGFGAANYTLKEGGKSVVIAKSPLLATGKGEEWWLPKVPTPEAMWMFLMSADSDMKLKAGQVLKAKFHDKMIPLEDMYNEVWWMSNQESISPVMGNRGLSKMSVRKIIDNIVKKNYTTLVSRIVNN